MLPLRTALRLTCTATATRHLQTQSIRLSSSNSSSEPSHAKLGSEDQAKDKNSNDQSGKKKTMAQMDEELRQKMSGLAGDGGEAGVEMEDGQPVSMKRSVKQNMFRYI